MGRDGNSGTAMGEGGDHDPITVELAKGNGGSAEPAEGAVEAQDVAVAEAEGGAGVPEGVVEAKGAEGVGAPRGVEAMASLAPIRWAWCGHRVVGHGRSSDSAHNSKRSTEPRAAQEPHAGGHRRASPRGRRWPTAR